MKIVHTMLTHVPTPHALSTIDHLAQTSQLVVHVDAATDISLYELEERGAVPTYERTHVRWGGASMVFATLNLLRTAVDLAEPDDYVVLVSGDSYPLQPPERLEQFFAAGAGAQYIDAARMPTHRRPLNRLSRRYYEFDAPDRSLHLRERALNYLRLPRPWRRRFEGFVPYGGSQWFALTGAAVRHVLSVVDSRPDLLEFIRLSHVPDEFFFQTIMMASPFAGDIRPSLMFTDWSDAAADHPATISEDLIWKLSTSPGLVVEHRDVGRGPVMYARKFPAVSKKLVRSVQENVWAVPVDA